MPRGQDDILGDAAEGAPDGTLLAGRYRVIRLLGRGAMGAVYLAEDLTLEGEQVAVKVLPRDVAAGSTALKALKDEARHAHKLSHPNIVTLRRLEVTQDGSFLVMDFVEGRTLADELATLGRMTAGQVVRLLRPLAEALDYAHEQGLVHRDVKPGNVLIRSDGTALLTDFGVAVDQRAGSGTGDDPPPPGTLSYMSPEQLDGHAPASPQDVYGLAATMYECLAGRPPFFRGSIEWQVRHKDPDPPPQADTPFAAAVMAGLAKDPSQRPATCQDLVDPVLPPPPPSAAPEAPPVDPPSHWTRGTKKAPVVLDSTSRGERRRSRSHRARPLGSVRIGPRRGAGREAGDPAAAQRWADLETFLVVMMVGIVLGFLVMLWFKVRRPRFESTEPPPNSTSEDIEQGDHDR